MHAANAHASIQVTSSNQPQSNSVLAMPASFHNVLLRFRALFLVQLAAACESYVFDMAAPFAVFQSDEDFSKRIFVAQPMRTLVMYALAANDNAPIQATSK